MYSFQTGAGRRKAQKTVRILSVVVFVLAIALIGVTVSYLHASGVSRTTRPTRRKPPSTASHSPAAPTP